MTENRLSLRNISRLGPGFWMKLLGLAMVNGLGFWALPTLIREDQWAFIVALLVGLAGINWVYFSKRAFPLRWLVPGLVFMLLMVVYPIIFTFFVALSNWSTGHTLTKQVALERTLQRTFLPEDPQRFDLWYFADPAIEPDELEPADLRMLLRSEEGEFFYGTPRLQSAEPVEGATVDLETLEVVDDDGDGVPDRIDGLAQLNVAALLRVPSIAAGQLALDVPLEQGLSQALADQARTAALREFKYTYDAAADAVIDNETGEVCPADGTIGNFVCPDGSFGQTFGWRVSIGLSNFTDVATDPRIRDPFIRVFVWNVSYAFLSVLLQFSIGMILALAFQDERLKGRAVYRSLLILPWAMPAFLSIIVWRGLLQGLPTGPINSLIGAFGIDAVSWLNDPFWAKVAVLLVNTWMGFPYMFLIISGALQAVPTDVQEAARVDGASGPMVWRTVTLPLLMIGVSPLLIASFAFNFNNFINIFLLTAGGPAIGGYDVPVGETDILISFTYNLAQASGRGQDFGLASAITFFIFLIVVVLSAISFRYTRRLENIYGSA